MCQGRIRRGKYLKLWIPLDVTWVMLKFYRAEEKFTKGMAAMKGKFKISLYTNVAEHQKVCDNTNFMVLETL